MRNNKYLVILFLLFFFLINTFFVGTSVDGGDGGDFLYSIVKGGIPHASGYPLYTILGILFDRMIPFGTTAWKVGLVSSVFLTAAGYMFFLLAGKFVQNIVIGFVSTLIFLFSYPIWIHGVHVEVFSMHVFFVLSILFYTVSLAEKFNQKSLYILSFIVGLALSNNQSIILIFPSILIMLLINWKRLLHPKIIGVSFLFLILGLLPYLYIFYVALFQNYNPDLRFQNVGEVIQYILRMNYGWSAAALSTENRFYTLLSFGHYMYYHLSYLIILVSVAGFYKIYKVSKKAFFILFAAFFFFGPFYILYGNAQLYNEYFLFVLERFYLSPIAVLLIGLAPGLALFVNIIERLLSNKVPDSRIKVYSKIAISFLFIIPILLAVKNMPKVNLHSVSTGDDIAHDIIYTISPKAIVFFDSDSMVYNTLYIMAKDGNSKDMLIATDRSVNKLITGDKEDSLRKELEKRYPRLKKSSIDFLMLLFTPHKRPIFSTFKIELPEDLEKLYEWKAKGLLFELININERQKKEEYVRDTSLLYKKYHVPFSYHPVYTENLIMLEMKNLYAKSYLNTAMYAYETYNDLDVYKNYIDLSLKIKNDFPPAYEQLGNYYLIQKNCSEAEKAFTQLYTFKPNVKASYIYLYLVYESCMKDKEKADSIKNEFKSKFNSDIVTSKSSN